MSEKDKATSRAGRAKIEWRPVVQFIGTDLSALVDVVRLLLARAKADGQKTA